VVTIPLDTPQESEVAAGDMVSVTLPDGTTTPGAVFLVGTVAATVAPRTVVVTAVAFRRRGSAASTSPSSTAGAQPVIT
jgi:hypothetical protein